MVLFGRDFVDLVFAQQLVQALLLVSRDGQGWALERLERRRGFERGSFPALPFGFRLGCCLLLGGPFCVLERLGLRLGLTRSSGCLG